jgi:hypothetical protein
MTVQPSLLTLLDPINPRTQIDRIAGIDAPCPQGKRESECQHPFCTCYSPDRSNEGGNE